jgi:hypothetical protein
LGSRRRWTPGHWRPSKSPASRLKGIHETTFPVIFGIATLVFVAMSVLFSSTDARLTRIILASLHAAVAFAGF